MSTNSVHGGNLGDPVARVSRLFIPTLVFALFCTPLYALEPADADAMPHVSARAKENFLSYIHAEPDKAFAIAPGGAWAWYAGAPSEDEAASRALNACQENTRQDCVLYAKNDVRIFDQMRWAQLWRPYLNPQQAAQREHGTTRNLRLYDFQYRDRQGRIHKLGAQHGKLAIVHFWGSWCPPCLRELPLLKAFQRKLQAQYPGQIELIMLQVREPFSQALSWATEHGFSELPLFDSGVKDSEDDQLTLTDGKTVADRQIARSFPSSYFLDRNGLILLNHRGPIHDWDAYLPFLEDVLKQTAR